MTAHITHATSQGFRARQEDRWVVASIDAPTSGILLAVLDGHGGPEAAECLAHELSILFKTAMERTSALRETLAMCFELCAEKVAEQKAGTTLSVVFIPSSESAAYIGTIGDSAVLIRAAGGSIYNNTEHNARSNLVERQLAISRGASYVHGYIMDPETGRGLQLTRALGDSELTAYIGREPEIQKILLDDQSIIVLATDGVFDSSHFSDAESVRRLLDRAEAGASAQTLVDEAQTASGLDNATAIVCHPYKTV